jgi:hypothetical protein
MHPNLRVLLSISDPWDLVTQIGVGPFGGAVLGSRGDELAVILDRSFRYRDCTVAGLSLAPRHMEPKDPWRLPPTCSVPVSAVPFLDPGGIGRGRGNI